MTFLVLVAAGVLAVAWLAAVFLGQRQCPWCHGTDETRRCEVGGVWVCRCGVCGSEWHEDE
jgi:hypothetical protein